MGMRRSWCVTPVVSEHVSNRRTFPPEVHHVLAIGDDGQVSPNLCEFRCESQEGQMRLEDLLVHLES